MPDRADVVPLRRRGASDLALPPNPAEVFLDAADPARALSLRWSPDSGAVTLSIGSLRIGTPAETPVVLMLTPDDVLDLARALVEGRPAPDPRPPAPVLPLRPRPER